MNLPVFFLLFSRAALRPAVVPSRSCPVESRGLGA
jgi:hypothetical protein